MADNIDRDRTEDSRIRTDDLDLGSLDDISLDLPGIDGNEGVEGGKGRKPAHPAKKYALEATKHLAGGVVSGIGAELKKVLPNTGVVVSDVNATLDDIKALRDDLTKNLAPITRSFVSASRKLLPAAETLLPKKVYQAIEKKLDEKVKSYRSETQHGPSKEQQEASYIQAELASLFNEQVAAQVTTQRETKKDLLIDRALGSIQHKQMTVHLTRAVPQDAAHGIYEEEPGAQVQAHLHRT